MRGWVYIITTKAMPDLLKVGYTLKDPELRAQGLGRTGLPHPYVVEYEVFVTNPKALEQNVHAALHDVREGREWFRCAVAHAVAQIRRIAGADAALERWRGATSDPEPAARTTKPPSTSEFRRTATYAAPCTHCGSPFSVTLTRYDSGAQCPHCFKTNDTSAFQRQVFVS